MRDQTLQRLWTTEQESLVVATTEHFKTGTFGFGFDAFRNQIDVQRAAERSVESRLELWLHCWPRSLRIGSIHLYLCACGHLLGGLLARA